MQQSGHNVVDLASSTDIAANVRSIRDRIAVAAASAGRDPAEITLVAICKTFPPGLVAEAHRAGLRHFGENRVQEAAEKIPGLSYLEPRPTWHMVGHLQTNKVKAALELFDFIESLDSVRLGQALARHAGGRRVPVLLEVNVSGEASKYGFTISELPEALRSLQGLPELEVKGLMTVAPMAQDLETVRPVFSRLRELRDRLGLRELSMGMTDDFEVAIQEGSTMVRIGRAIFGARPQE